MLAFFNAFHPMHMAVILVVALLLFGNRLPEVARSIGRSINEFKKGMREIKDELDEPDEPEKLSPPHEGTVSRRDAHDQTHPAPEREDSGPA